MLSSSVARAIAPNITVAPKNTTITQRTVLRVHASGRYPRATLRTVTDRPELAGLLGALVIAFSAILVRLADVTPVTAAFFRCAYAAARARAAGMDGAPPARPARAS